MFRVEFATRLRPHLPALMLITLISTLALCGVRAVPFHPDESTQLFTSADFDLWLSHPTAAGWQPGQDDDLRQRYRLLDAPLTHLVLGLGRAVAHQPPLPVDWDWSLSWQENALAGAVPSETLLTAGRTAVTLLLPLTLTLLYLTGLSLGGRRVGLLSILFLGLNPLTLLHARRAMAEGALLFGITFTLWALLSASRYRTIWLGIALGLTINAKQSALALLPTLALPASLSRRSILWLRQTISGLLITIVLSILLNPVFWSHPTLAMRSAAHLRTELARRQSADIARMNPEALLDSPSKRLIALLGNLFIVPPQFAEVDNYHTETATAVAAYLAQPLHTWGRGLAGGAFFLTLTLIGMGRAAREAWKGRTTFRVSRATQKVVWLWVATILQGGALLLMIPLPWQRYVIPLLPMVALWQAYALHPAIKKQP